MFGRALGAKSALRFCLPANKEVNFCLFRKAPLNDVGVTFATAKRMISRILRLLLKTLVGHLFFGIVCFCSKDRVINLK